MKAEIRKNFCSLCARGNISSAFLYLGNLKNPSSDTVKLRDKIRKRFFLDDPRYLIRHDNPFLRRICRIYCEYFKDVLTQSKKPVTAEEDLLQKLMTLLCLSGKPELNEVEAKISEILLKQGFYFLGGKTGQFYGPYIYKEREKKTYLVQLPDETRELAVYFMDGFIMRSWLSFASFDLTGTGGWAKTDGLYCVKKCYSKKFDKEDFQISYLKHEAQHFSDYEKFPELKPWQLEFRAKLVELIYSESRKPLLWFLAEASFDMENPHSYASGMIMKELSNLSALESSDKKIDWKKIPMKQIQDFSRKIYHQNTVILKENGE